MRTSSVQCDVCGGMHGDVAHWYGAKVVSGTGALTIRPLSQWECASDASLHACGQSCMLVLTERYLDGLEAA